MGCKSKGKRAPKRRHRKSTLPAGEGGRILDRLLLLEHVIPRGEVLQVLHDTGCLDVRCCTLTFEVTCWLVLAMGLLTDLPLRQVFKAARRLYPGEDTPHRSTLCKARQRLGVAPVRLLFERLARPLAGPDTPGAFYKGLRLMGLDGVIYNVPDSDANAAAFGYPQGGRGQGAFPQVRKLSLVELGTHAEQALVVKGIKEKDSGEQSMAPTLFHHLRPGMLLLWDRGFFSYLLWQGVLLRSCELLARVSTRLVLRPTQPLPDGSHLARLYPSAHDRSQERWGIVVRVIRYTHTDPRRVGCGQQHVLLTTLLDAQTWPAQELIVLYHERWEIELTFDEQKTHQTPPRPTKPAHLRSETPLGVLQELYALAIAHYATRDLMAGAAAQEGLDPDRLSFVGCLQIVRTRLPECPAEPAAGRRWQETLRGELGKERTEPRRHRINPRVVRIKMSKFKKKRLEHRGLRPLEKAFGDTIVVQLVAQPDAQA
jgi:Insertion element 4 transposase N-terminal/Transposase DDE domain